MPISMYTIAVVAVAALHAVALQESGSVRYRANPIRKVVTMLETLKKKVEAEGESELALYKKYMCYCKTSDGELAESIASAEAKGPEVSASIKEGEALKAQLDSDLVQHKEGRAAAKQAMEDAAAIREKEASAYAATKSTYGANIDALEKAVAALSKGMAGAFLQTNAGNALQNLVQSTDAMGDADRQEVMAFLTAAHGSDYAPASGQIVGILKQLGDEMAAGLADATAAEEEAIKNYDGLTAAKTKEIEAATAAIEKKSTRTGELAVSIVEMKNDLEDTEAALAEDKAFMADLKKNCDTKTAEWDDIVKTRSEEVVALSETIKLLNDDDALDLFKKTLPSPASSFVQVKVTSGSVRARALAVIHAAQKLSKPSRQQLDFIALALHGNSVGFEKVISMIDEMVETLKKEQADDEAKKSYCATEFDTSDDKKKGLELAIKDSEGAIAAAEEGIASLTNEIKALEAGIKELDAAVAEATELRKSEHEEFTTLMSDDTAAKELIGVAKNRLNKFYNPKLYLPPPKSEEEAPVFAQVSAHVQHEVAPPAPPETFGAYSKKSEESTGVIAMMDLLIKDLEKEMTVAETDEKDAQAEYEKMMSDSAEKRAADAKSLSTKEAAKADTEEALQAHSADKASSTKELSSTLEAIAALHSECDWLIQYYDTRKEARDAEIESLGNAKAVLSGADFSLLQASVRNVRRH